jgi:hypothetical protein
MRSEPELKQVAGLFTLVCIVSSQPLLREYVTVQPPIEPFNDQGLSSANDMKPDELLKGLETVRIDRVAVDPGHKLEIRRRLDEVGDVEIGGDRLKRGARSLSRHLEGVLKPT